MNKSLMMGLLCLFSHRLSAQSLDECEARIFDLLSQVKTQEVRVLALNKDGIDPAEARLDTYHMSSNTLCGVELIKESGLLTVTKFKGLNEIDSDKISRDVVKFESIVLNGSDPTRSNGRIKSKVSCSMTESSVRYITRVPILTDGIRSPWAIEELTVIVTGNNINFSLRASISPINKVFRSITDCKLTVE